MYVYEIAMCVCVCARARPPAWVRSILFKLFNQLTNILEIWWRRYAIETQTSYFWILPHIIGESTII
jgi:hypothetical protein